MIKTTDKLNRPLHDLRISVIDRCNFRCTYCMPEETYSQHYQFLKKEEWLTFDEIIRLVRAFTQLGVKKVRLTGGEPLLRPDLPELIRELSQISDIEDLALTTNGMLLKEFAAPLKQAGLKRLNLSLDTLDSRVFHLMNGHRGSVDDVLNGLKAAEGVGFQSVKINVVVQRGVNDNTVMDMVRYFRNSGHVLRFIEY
ncbi:MAG: radical SAM protein, partial [Candidatus Omnitrophica bacterium]|nr:radical SAM protein [Candidatus Omnitrophota bacterium]